MAMKELKNVDPFRELPENKIRAEELSNVSADIPTHLIHDIFYGNTVFLYTDKSAPDTTRLILNKDYLFAETDSIASEQSAIDCFRAIIFKAPYATLFVDYHVYGDLVTAELFNDFATEMNTLVKKLENTSDTIDALDNGFTGHFNDKMAHGAVSKIEPNRIVLRTQAGSIRTAPPENDDEATPLSTVNENIQTAKWELLKKIGEANALMGDVTETLNLKIQAKNPALTQSDFYPPGITDDDATPADKAQALTDLKARSTETKPYHNALRNEKGSVTVPSPTANSDAAPKDYIDTKTQALEAKINAIPAPYVDAYSSTTETKTNKTWNGKPIYRRIVQKKVDLGDNYEYTIPNSTNAWEITHIQGFTKTVDGSNTTCELLPNKYFSLSWQKNILTFIRNSINTKTVLNVTIEYIKT